jgi:hypothetical protein
VSIKSDAWHIDVVIVSFSGHLALGTAPGMRAQAKMFQLRKIKVSWESLPAPILTPVSTPIATSKRPQFTLVIVYWLSKAFGIAPVSYSRDTEKFERTWKNVLYRCEFFILLKIRGEFNVFLIILL